jgi:ATP-dependent RNA helicase DHX8/PRP22
MEDELYKLEELSLVNKVTQEIFNFTGNHDKTLAEFVIAVSINSAAGCTVNSTEPFYPTQLHRKSKKFDVFQSKLKEVGAPFPDSFIQNLDRIILAMHPKYKKKAKKAAEAMANGVNGKGKAGDKDAVRDEDADRRARLYPGLALPDTSWKPIDKFIEEEQKAGPIVKDVDDLMKELEGVAAKKNTRPSASDYMEDGADGPAAKRQRRDDGNEGRRGRSPPPHMADNGYGPRSGGPSNGYGSGDRGGYGGSRGRPQLDEKPLLYKIYNGRVSSMKDFGAFVSLEGVQGRAEGE